MPVRREFDPTGRRPRSPRRAPGPKGRRRIHGYTPHDAPSQRPLYTAEDHGAPCVILPDHFAPPQRERGWGPFAESFVRLNTDAVTSLGAQIQVEAGTYGAAVRLVPGGRAGAIPLRSPQSGQVVGGFMVQPRFGWSGVGQVLGQTGWHAAPTFLDLPLVPGSGRAIPRWVLAGPVLVRLQALLRSLRRGYRDTEDVLQRPRGRILWQAYQRDSLARGHWHRLPCRYPDLDHDPRLRQAVRWTVERLRRDLLVVGRRDRVAESLADLAAHLLEELRDVIPAPPRPDDLDRMTSHNRILDEALHRGLEAISWVVNERGLAGGQEFDGLAWMLPLEQLWERFVEAVVRRRVALTGGAIHTGRQGETTFPLRWTDPVHRSLGHLEPDIVVQRGRSVHIYDAKYKAHLAELDEHGWRRFADESRADHRADLHQVLAYAALYDADDITATLVYPLRVATWTSLHKRGRDVSEAELLHGERRVRLQLWGLPFGHGLQAEGLEAVDR